MKKDFDQWFYDHPKALALTCLASFIFGVGLGIWDVKRKR